MQKFSYLKSVNAEYIDELFQRYKEDPDSVDPTWRYFFEGLELGSKTPEPADAKTTTQSPVTTLTSPGTSEPILANIDDEAKVSQVITAYREYGRVLADIDPLNPPPRSHRLLDLSRWYLKEADLQKTFTASRLITMERPATLAEIIGHLRDTYCTKIAVEFTHIPDPDERQWLQLIMERTRNRPSLDFETRKFILKRLIQTESLERFLHTRYVAQKRFSLEGGESLISALDCMIEAGAELGAQEFVLGMAHRGRLNVLVNIFGKKPEYLFTEFEGAYKIDTSAGEGDVKYHMGYSADFTTRKGKAVHISLASNPSHLEFVNPVIEGIARAKQTFLGDTDRSRVIPIAIHGDAAFAGQGVCYETLNLSQLEGYETGGTLHIVINNQVGFTTDPRDARSTTYATDVAKMLEVPIFHVNGDDPEAVWYVARLCIEYRQKFKKDAVIDLVCYRKHGHNEGDEPSFTQPVLYKKIKAHPSPRELYARSLTESGVIANSEGEGWVEQSMASLAEAQARTKSQPLQPQVSAFEGRWANLRKAGDADVFKSVETKVDEQTLKGLSGKLNAVPPGFHIHPKLGRFFEARARAVEDGKGIDWGNAEILAYASLLNEGFPVRLSGQDAERGTFTHRHAVLSDFESGEKYTPLNSIRDGQARFMAHNSLLSETAVLGFEYGYSLADPLSLVIWEAQFGDFANGAQVIIDQFICSSESKWQRVSGVVLLLPHGYEGQGPEHSSARLERFLQLCGKGNMSVCNLTTPAQLFHALRRQMKRDFRKPLVIMSPKSLLRHPHATSALSELSTGSLQEVIDDLEIVPGQEGQVTKVILCSGKVYYELANERRERKMSNVAIVRLEQLYPWPAARLSATLSRYPGAKTLLWLQEEPRNMGAWSYVFNMWNGGYEQFRESVANQAIQYVGREIGAAPAVGSAKLHAQEQKSLIERALA